MRALHFDNFAYKWEDGLPIGNGRLAAMIWGDEEKDIVSLNHEHLWTGDFKNRECEEGAHFLPYVREYLKAGENFKATALAAVAFGGNGGISPLQRRMDSYQPAGELFFTHTRMTETNRTLDTIAGMAKTYKHGSSSIQLEAFCHATQNIVMLRWCGEKKFTGKLYFAREETEGVKQQLSANPNEIEFNCDGGAGIGFKIKIHLDTDGTSQVTKGNQIIITDATYISAYINIGTEWRGIEKELSQQAVLNDSFEVLKKQHEEAFSSVMEQWKIRLYDDETSVLEKMPINKRQQRMQQGKSDAGLLGIYAWYGVYLMVSGSLCAQLPLNLQGKWNRELSPKWNSDYHLNINLQMNYWFTEALGMDEYSRQMTDYVLSLLPKARIAAQKMYGCRGVVYPLNSDIWGNVTSEAYNYAVWVAAAGWLAAHFWRSWCYTGDTEYLREYAYPFFKEVAQFYEDYLIIDENNIAQIIPSQSPENKYESCGYFPVSMCISSAMDVQVAYEALYFAESAANQLGVNKECANHWNFLRTHLPPFSIGKDGRLLEWDSDDKIEIEKGHRHVSHLYGVYPAQLFTPENRTAQFEAAQKSLEYRLAHSGGHTGWSSAWSACLFARFLKGEKVDECLRHLVANQSSRSLLDLHPDYYPQSRENLKNPKDEPLLFTAPEKDPPMIFQIDGNMGATAALLEALVQTRDDIVHLLPAISDAWKKGELKGIRVPGGHILNFLFEDGRITKLSATFGFAQKLSLMLPGESQVKTYTGRKGTKIEIPCLN